MKDLEKNKNECDNARKLYIARRDACYIARRDNPALHALHADLANYSFNAAHDACDAIKLINKDK